jgi:predicted small metal-binding protein
LLCRPSTTRWTITISSARIALSIHARRRREMAYQINCECGYVVRGESEDEVVANAEQHIQSDHPDMVGQVSREDLLAQAEEV